MVEVMETRGLKAHRVRRESSEKAPLQANFSIRRLLRQHSGKKLLPSGDKTIN